MPLIVTSFDFLNRSIYAIKKKDYLLRDAVLASCSMPGVFQPVSLDNKLLFDGGVLSPLPVRPLIREGIKKVICVSVTPTKGEAAKTYSRFSKKLGLFDFIFGSIEAMQSELIQQDMPLVDILIHPCFEGVLWTDFSNPEYFINKGKEEALKYIDRIGVL